MSEVRAELKYLSSHEWAKVEADGTVAVGITDYAQDSLGDVVYVDVPEVGATVKVGEQISVVESVKTASDIYAPVSGEVVAINELLEDTPETVNSSPYDNGWFFKIKPTDVSELDAALDSDGYTKIIGD